MATTGEIAAGRRLAACGLDFQATPMPSRSENHEPYGISRG